MLEYFKENPYLRKREQTGVNKYIKLLKKWRVISINWRDRIKFIIGMSYKKQKVNLNNKKKSKIIYKNIKKN